MRLSCFSDPPIRANENAYSSLLIDVYNEDRFSQFIKFIPLNPEMQTGEVRASFSRFCETITKRRFWLFLSPLFTAFALMSAVCFLSRVMLCKQTHKQRNKQTKGFLDTNE